jgi:hypothetical protein
MQRCHHGHVKVTQQFEQMTAGSASENSEPQGSPEKGKKPLKINRRNDFRGFELQQ